MLGVIWWMYGGYAWLTNAVSAHTISRRLLLLGGMAAYFVLALSVPDAFESTGLAFGLAYVVIVVIHTVLFTRATAVSAARAILTLAPYNLVVGTGRARRRRGRRPRAVLPLGGGGPARVADAGDSGYERLPDRAGALRRAPRRGRDHRDRRIRRCHRARRLAPAGRRLAGRRRRRRTRARRVPLVDLLRRRRGARRGGPPGSAAAHACACRTACLRLLAHADAARDHRRGGRRARSSRSPVRLADVGAGGDPRRRASPPTSPATSRSVASCGSAGSRSGLRVRSCRWPRSPSAWACRRSPRPPCSSLSWWPSCWPRRLSPAPARR